MAHIVEHIVLSGWKGIINDVPLIVGVCSHGGVFLSRSSAWFKIHRFTHSWQFILFLVGCQLIFLPRGFCRPAVEHIILDYLTHEKGWLNKTDVT